MIPFSFSPEIQQNSFQQPCILVISLHQKDPTGVIRSNVDQPQFKNLGSIERLHFIDKHILAPRIARLHAAGGCIFSAPSMVARQELWTYHQLSSRTIGPSYTIVCSGVMFDQGFQAPHNVARPWHIVRRDEESCIKRDLRQLC